jgi:hypothetical protein
MLRICSVFVLLGTLLLGCQSSDKQELFTEVSRNKTGIDFRNLLREDENFNIFKYQYFNNGGGLAIGDFNNDGLEDIVFTGNMVKNRLYINQGDFHFEDVTTSSGIAEKEGWCTGVTTVDINQDGWLDIYICRAGYPFDDLRSNLLFINNGDLTFTEKAAEYGIDDLAYSTHSAFFDYDLDGDLDLFLLNHSTVEYSRGSQEVFQLRNKKDPDFTNKLFRNDGAQFTNVTTEAGIYGNVLTFSLGISISDINQDGWPDIYIGNDFNEPDYLFLNQQDGTFKDMASGAFDHTAMFSMGSDMADINNDGLVDLVSLDMLPHSNYQQKMHAGVDNYDKINMLAEGGFHHQSSRNMLQLNNGDGTFTEIGQFAGVSNTNWSWAPLFFDFDNDGYKDLFVANGYPKDHTDMDFLNFTANEVIKINRGETPVDFEGYMAEMPPIIVPNYFFKNIDGLRFENHTSTWGLDKEMVSQSAAYADLDNDGDLDLVLNNTGDYATVYQNNARAINDNHYLKINLSGNKENPQGIGTKVYAHAQGKVFFQEQQPVRGFQSTVGGVLHFGLGNISQVDSVVLVLPNHSQVVLNNVAVDQTLEVDLETAQQNTTEKKAASSLFSATSLLDFKHEERSFNDFKIQSLLPWFFSCMGPALAVGDANGDGLDDVFMGNGAGAAGQLWYQKQEGGFMSVNSLLSSPESMIYEDSDAVFFDANGDDYLDLYVASGSYEFPAEAPQLRDRLYFGTPNGAFRTDGNTLPTKHISTNCVAAADVDQDGDTDLFIGGGYKYGGYPESYPSQLLLNDGSGNFTSQDVPADNVTAASWGDFNGDQKMELLVLGEWTTPRIYEFANGQLVEQTQKYFSQPYFGLWNSLHLVDIDQDGDLDVVAGNLGINTQLKASEEEPLELYAGDFDNNGGVDPLLFYHVDGQSWPFASRDDLISQLPELKRKFLYFKDYATAQLPDILLPEAIAEARKYQASYLETMIFENIDGKLQSRPLPASAQMSPVHAITATDVDQDGKTDLILAGNTLQAKVKLGRMDGNHGLVLLQQEGGGFVAATPEESGLLVRGRTNQVAIITSKTTQYLLFARNKEAVVAYQLNN